MITTVCGGGKNIYEMKVSSDIMVCPRDNDCPIDTCHHMYEHSKTRLCVYGCRINGRACQLVHIHNHSTYRIRV